MIPTFWSKKSAKRSFASVLISLNFDAKLRFALLKLKKNPFLSRNCSICVNRLKFQEMEEMLRITQPNESIHMHAFNCRPPEPGKRCDGETKVVANCNCNYKFYEVINCFDQDIYRRNAMAKIKHRLRHLGRKNNRPLKPHEIPVMDHRSQAQPVQVKITVFWKKK